MIIESVNPSQLILQVVPQNPDGSPKTTFISKKVRVYHIVSGSEVEDLASTDLVYIVASKTLRYIWEPAALAENNYTIEFDVVDTDSIQAIFVEDLIISSSADAAGIDTQLSGTHGSGTWTTYPNTGIPSVSPGDGESC